jgi:hypothetical protein
MNEAVAAPGRKVVRLLVEVDAASGDDRLLNYLRRTSQEIDSMILGSAPLPVVNEWEWHEWSDDGREFAQFGKIDRRGRISYRSIL